MEFGLTQDGAQTVFACPGCIERSVKRKAITVDEETSWGKVWATKQFKEN
jgi:hypothetical protein